METFYLFHLFHKEREKINAVILTLIYQFLYLKIQVISSNVISNQLIIKEGIHIN